ncbi:MAG: PAS domain S-box protein [Planctomycetota bacterium]
MIVKTADGMIVVDRGGVVRFVNPAAEELFGRAAGELVGQPLGLRMEAAETTEVDIVRRDGARAVGDIRVVEVEWEGRAASLLSMRDISERKRVEEALRESEERFRLAFEEGPIGMALVGRDFRLLKVNRALCAMVGYTEDELTARTFADITHRDDIDKDVQLARRLFRGEIPSYSLDKRYLSKTGKILWVHLTATVIRGPAGNVLYGLGMIEDVTERKKVEGAIRNLALRQQAGREEDRATIAREIHDELGQALTGLKMDLSWLLDRLPPDSRGLRQRTRTMVSRADRTLEAVRRISTRLRPAVLDNLGLEAAIEWEAREFTRRVGIECAVDLRLGRIPVDPDRETAVFRIFQESLTNVARHARATRVEVQLRIDGDELVLVVRDNGRGISEEAASSALSLGFIGMRERAGALDGRVTIQRGAGGGTEVTLAVPLRKARDPSVP